MKKRVILKISGEALSGETKVGINQDKVLEIAKEIKELYNNGEIELGIVCGAGNIFRGREAIKSGMDRSSADYMGMLGTIINAKALENALRSLDLDARAMLSLNIPVVAEPYIKEQCIHHMLRNRIIIFGGGTGLPFFSTDSCAALRACELNCDVILMAKNGIDGVYDSDPRTNKNALRFTKLSHQDVIDKGLQVMDQTAAALCKDNNIDIFVFDMNKKGNIKKAATDYSFGTIITNK